jgi:hypothetical protein
MVKISDTQQAWMSNNLRNADQKLLKSSAAIWFKKICRENQLTRKYANIELKGSNQPHFS